MLVLLTTGCSQREIDVFMQSPLGDSYNTRVYARLDNEPFPIQAVNLAQLPPQYRRQVVNYSTSEKPGTIVVDPAARFLYLVGENGKAMRYGIEVGRDGFRWSGVATVARKQEWPMWTPPAEMVARDPRTAPYASGMPGGPENPLGARALYLYQNGADTLYRIHGGGRASTIGEATSSGCIRLLDHDIIDLYSRVPDGTTTVVLPSQVASRPAARS